VKSHEPRLSHQTLRVLAALLTDDHRGELSGAQLSRETGLASGSLYPMLARLEDAGWLSSRWETEDPRALGRPRRRFYRVTGLGAAKAQAALKPLEPAIRRLSWT